MDSIVYRCPRCHRVLGPSMYCPACKLQCTKPAASPAPKKNNFIPVIALCFALVIVVLVGYNFSSTKNESPPNPQAQETQEAQAPPRASSSIDYKDKSQEMLNALNALYGDGNTYTPIYAGDAYDHGTETLIVKVNDNWGLISADAKKGFVKSVYVAWNSMASSRNIEIDQNIFNVSIVSIMSGDEVAGWSNIRGTHINGQ